MDELKRTMELRDCERPDDSASAVDRPDPGTVPAGVLLEWRCSNPSTHTGIVV